MTIKRGLRVGAQLFAAKMEHHIEYLKEDEVWIVAESPIGFKRWMIEYELEDRSAQYPAVRHELGGVPTFALTRKLWDAVKAVKNTGTRPVHFTLLTASQSLRRGVGGHSAELVADGGVLRGAVPSRYSIIQRLKPMGLSQHADLVFLEILDVVLHLGGKKLGADATLVVAQGCGGSCRAWGPRGGS